jgi:hypothetical protein
MVGPLDRKIVKTPVMSYFYGATRIGMSEQILEIIKKRNKKLPRGEKTPVRTFSVHKVNGISYGKFASIFSLREVNGVSLRPFPRWLFAVHARRRPLWADRRKRAKGGGRDEFPQRSCRERRQP